MEESVLLHRLESRTPGQKIQAIDELSGIVKESGKLHFNNKLSLFSSFKRILQDEDLLLRTKCSKLICDILPKLGCDMDTCMSFVMPNILGNMAANNLVLKRESIKLVRCFSEITSDRNALIRSIIWEGVDNKDPALAREVILALDKLILNILQTEDCYNIVTALCKRYYLEENKKVRRAIRDSYISITGVIGLSKMEEIVTQLPSSALSSGKELLQNYKHTDKPKITSYKSVSKLEVDSAISVEMKLLWDLIPDSTLTKLHGDDVVEQLKAISELETAIRKVTNPPDFLICIDEICEAIIKVIPINNFRIFKASTTLVSAFVEVFRDVLGDCVYPLTRVLCHKIGDNKIAVREGTMKCLTLLMKVCGPRPVLDVVLVSFRDRNARVREEAINVVIKTMLTFPLQDLNVGAVAEYLATMLGDSRQRVVNAALDAIIVLKDRLSARDVGIIFRAVEKVDMSDKRYFHALKERIDKGAVSTVNDAGLVTHGEGCFSRNGTPMGGSTSRISNHSISVPTTSQERLLSKDPTMVCPPTPMSLPRRYYSAGRNRLPWERPSRQNTLVYKGSEDQFRGAEQQRSHVFIKGGGARSDGGSYAQMHLKKMQKESDEQQHGTSQAVSPRANTLGSLKKYFPSVKGSPDPKRSWPTMKQQGQDDEVLSNGSAPVKSNSFANDSYGVQTSSMYESFRVNSGESSGVGTLTNNTPNGSASLPPRQNHFSPSTTLNDSGIFEEHSFVNVKTATSQPPPDRTARKPRKRTQSDSRSKRSNSHTNLQSNSHTNLQSHSYTNLQSRTNLHSCSHTNLQSHTNLHSHSHTSLPHSPRHLVLKPTSDESLDWDLAFCRAKTLTLTKSWNRPKSILKQRASRDALLRGPRDSDALLRGPRDSDALLRGLSSTNCPISTHTAEQIAMSLDQEYDTSRHSAGTKSDGRTSTAESSTRTLEGRKSKAESSARKCDGPAVRTKSSKKLAVIRTQKKIPRYYPRSPDPETPERSVEKCPLSPEDLPSTARMGKEKMRARRAGEESVGKRTGEESVGKRKEKARQERPENAPHFAAEGVMLPAIDTKRTKSSKNIKSKSAPKGYRVIPMIEIAKLAKERGSSRLPSIKCETERRQRPSDSRQTEIMQRTTPQASEEERSTPPGRDKSTKEGRLKGARRDILQEEEMRREEERLELAKWEKIRMEELAKEEKRRAQMRAQLQRENEQAEQDRREEEIRKESYHIGNGYVELTSQNLAKKKLKQAAEDSRKPRPKLIKARTRTESINETDNANIDIVGKGLSSGHIEDVSKAESPKDKLKPNEDKTAPLRAPSGVYGQRVRPSRSPDPLDGSLSDDDDDEDEEGYKEQRLNRDGHPIGSGLSAATRMRFEKKRAQYVERQSAEQRLPRAEPERTSSCQQDQPPPARVQYGKPVSAPVESRLNADTVAKRSPSKTNVRANSLKPHDAGGEVEVQNSSLVDEKEEVPLMNPESAIQGAIKNIKIGGEEWTYKIQGLHVLRRAARHHPDIFQNDLLTYIRLTCGEVANLRSTVSRLAIQIVGDYFVMLKAVMDSDIDRTCECLLAKTGDTNQFIKNDIIATLGKMVENATPSRVLMALINCGGSHKNSTIRSVTANCLKDVVTRMGVNRCLAAKDIAPKFLATLEKFSHDGNQETRYYGKLVLSWCMEHPNLDALCHKHLSATAARNIRDMCDKLQSKGVGSLPQSSDRTSGRYRSQPVSRAQSNLSATYPGNRSRKPSQESLNVTAEPMSAASPRVSRRPGPRRDLRETQADKMPQSLYTNLNSSNWQDRYSGIAELLELCIKQSSDVRQCIVRISDAFTPRLKDPNSKVNLYALQCLLRMLPHLETSLDHVLTPFTEQLVPNLASQRANIVTLTSQILDGFRVHVDNPQLVCEYCRIVRCQNNPRIKPIILDKISDMIRDVHEMRPKLVEQMTVPIIIENSECLIQNTGANSLGAYVGRLASLLYQCMGTKLLTEITRIHPASVGTIRDYLVVNT